MTVQNHNSADRKSLDDYSDIPRGDECKQLVEKLNRNLYTASSNIQTTLKQMTHVETRIGHEINLLSSCLQENLSKCTTSYAPHEERLVQLDTAKRNLKQLTTLLDARKIFDSEDGQAEKLKDRPIDDSLLPTLVAIGDNLKTIKKLGAKPKFDAETYHKTKDRYLTWKGTEFAIKFGTADGLDEINEAFSSLNSKKDFYRLYQHHFEQSLATILRQYSNISENPSINDLGHGFIDKASEHFKIHMSSLCKYCEENDSFSRLLDAWKSFLKNGAIENILEQSMDSYNNFELLNDLKKLVINIERSNGEEHNENQEMVENIEKIMLNGILESARKPLASKLTTMVEDPPLNFRSVAEISTSLENFSYLLKEISFQLIEIYSEDGKDFLVSIIQPIVAEFTKRLCRMEDNSVPKAKVEDYLERLSLAGQLHGIMEDYKSQTGISGGPELKNAKKWMNDRIKEAIRASYRFVTDRMPRHGSDVYADKEGIVKSVLPTPQDFVVTATQNLLHLLRFWEEAMANEMSRIALSIHFSQNNEDPLSPPDDDAIFAAVLDKISNQIVKKLLQSINDVWMTDGKTATLSKSLIKEFLCDAEYLRDALIDLRAGAHTNLDGTIEKLQEQIKTMV